MKLVAVLTATLKESRYDAAILIAHRDYGGMGVPVIHVDTHEVVRLEAFRRHLRRLAGLVRWFIRANGGVRFLRQWSRFSEHSEQEDCQSKSEYHM